MIGRVPTIRAVTDRFLKYRTPAPVEDPTPRDLLLLLQDIQRGNDNFFILEHPADPGRFAQVIRADALSGAAQACYGTRAENGYVVEYRDGSADHHLQADCPTIDVTREILTGWVSGDDGWRGLVTWRRLDFGDEALTDDGASEASATLDHGEPEQDQVRHVRVETRAMVRAGFEPWPRVAQAAEEMLERDASGATRMAAVQAARDEWDQRAAEQTAWADQGDYDKLAAAFDDLESNRLVARMNFACCTSCGNAEIGSEVDPRGPVPSGYVYFHSQDAARLGETPTTLYLAYGAFREAHGITIGPDGPTEAQRDMLAAVTRQIGRRVADAIAGHGLEVSWDGTPDDAVRVTITDWRKRQPS